MDTNTCWQFVVGFGLFIAFVDNKKSPDLFIKVGWMKFPGYTRRMIAYDTKANKFVKCENLKERRMHHSATVINNKLYVTGGRILNGHDVIEDSDCFECYDPKTDVWTSKGSLPYKLFDHGSLPLVCVSNRPNPPWPTTNHPLGRTLFLSLTSPMPWFIGL